MTKTQLQKLIQAQKNLEAARKLVEEVAVDAATPNDIAHDLSEVVGLIDKARGNFVNPKSLQGLVHTLLMKGKKV